MSSSRIFAIILLLSPAIASAAEAPTAVDTDANRKIVRDAVNSFLGPISSADAANAFKKLPHFQDEMGPFASMLTRSAEGPTEAPPRDSGRETGVRDIARAASAMSSLAEEVSSPPPAAHGAHKEEESDHHGAHKEEQSEGAASGGITVAANVAVSVGVAIFGCLVVL